MILKNIPHKLYNSFSSQNETKIKHFVRKQIRIYLCIVTNERGVIMASISKRALFLCPFVDDLRPVQLCRTYVECFSNRVRTFELNRRAYWIRLKVLH